MAELPNGTPSFIRSPGILGVPIKLTNQVCSRDNPGNIPLIIYDNSAEYASGNGAIAENVTVCATGTVTKSVLFLFIKFTETIAPEWLLWHEIDLPALATADATTKGAGYPLRGELKRIYSPIPQAGSIPFADGLRINGESRQIQIGVALGTAIGSLPIIVYLEGGEY